ncbi:MAG: DUF4349 domain-containing protein [Eubacteriales bacterium]|nr:DUF4349 domain-containing protein [Eubacteriales bacterium]
MFKKKLVAIILVISLLFFISACAENSKDYGAGYADYEDSTAHIYNDSKDYRYDEVVSEEAEADLGEQLDRKIVYNYYLELLTTDGEALMKEVVKLEGEFGAYVINSQVNMAPEPYLEGQGRITAIEYSWRIPAEQAPKFVQALKELAEPNSISVERSDRTDLYKDQERRLEIKRQAEDRLLELLEEAENIEDILTIEERLTILRAEIEEIESNLKSIDKDVQESEIHAFVRVVKPQAISESQRTTSLGDRIKDYAAISVNGLKIGLEGILYFLIVAGPWLILLAIIVIILMLLIRRSRRKRGGRKSQDSILQEPLQVPQNNYEKKE